jgi:hypothetical protein
MGAKISNRSGSTEAMSLKPVRYAAGKSERPQPEGEG